MRMVARWHELVNSYVCALYIIVEEAPPSSKRQLAVAAAAQAGEKRGGQSGLASVIGAVGRRNGCIALHVGAGTRRARRHRTATAEHTDIQSKHDITQHTHC